MNNAAKKSYEYNDVNNLEQDAAVLETDDGILRGQTGTDLALLDDEFSDDDWLDEELTDEELAALGDEDFEAAFDDTFDDGDLGDLDDVDDFELLEGPAPASNEHAGLAAHPQGHAVLSDSQAQLANPPSAVLSDHLEDEFYDDAPLGAEDGLGDNHAQSVNRDHHGNALGDLDEFSADNNYTGEEDFLSQNSDTGYSEEDDFVYDDSDDFSIDDDLNESIAKENLRNAAIVTVGSTEVKAKDTGGVSVATDEEEDEETVESSPRASVEDYEPIDEEFSDLDDDGTYHRPVPRISIHAFCETQRNSAILERAAIDRRLMKAHFTMHMGGLGKAVDLYQTSSTPNLIIIETLSGGSDLIQQLGQLAEVCDPSTKVILIGKVNDIRLYRELIRQGISEYIVRPKSPLQIIKSISELYVDPTAQPIGKTIAFVGTRGGVGSSTLAHNLGWLFAEEHKSDTIILDLDLPFGTTALDFDHEPTSGLIEALTSPERLDDVLLERLLQKHTDHLSLLTAPNMLDRDYDIDNEAFDTVIDIVRGAAPTVVIDVPHNWTGWSRKILQTADEIVITATPDFASFRNMKYLIEVVGGARPNDSKPYFVYNQYDPKLSAVPVEYFVENVDIEPSLILGWEPQLFNAAATNASSIVETSPKSKVAQGMNELSAKILGRSEPLALPSRFSLTSLFKRK